MNKEEKKHYDRVARLGCSLCRTLGYYDTPCEIHHVRRHGNPRDKSPVIGLCPEHHRGNTGLHGLGRKGFEKKYGLTEEDLLEVTEVLLMYS
jgi:Recombination enhancement, RecA-dependent nuclease